MHSAIRQRLLLAAAATVIACPIALAAEISSAPPISGTYLNPYPTVGMDGGETLPTERDFSGMTHIRLEGRIEPGDYEKLLEFIGDVARFNNVILSLDSAGGSFAEALKLVDLVYQARIATFVGAGDECLSACAIVFLGGRAEMLRHIWFEPARTMHVTARVGFHAPFNSELPTGVTIEPGMDISVVAELFFAQSREVIRALQSRMEDWQVTADFVFQFLGHGPEEFYEIDHFLVRSENRIEIVADEVTFPTDLGLVEAVAGCSFVMDANFEPAKNFRFGLPSSFPSFSGPWFFHHGLFLQGSQTSSFEDWVQGTEDDPLFASEMLSAAWGLFRCEVWRDEKGRWTVQTSGDYPAVPDIGGEHPLIDEESPYVINSYSMLGTYLPWTAIGGPDLFIEDRETLETIIPAELRHIDSASFDCGGDLDPDARIICRFPTLARFDGIMAALYQQELAEDESVRSSQRRWLEIRKRACRAAHADLDDEAVMMMRGYCLLYLTVSRVNELTGNIVE